MSEINLKKDGSGNLPSNQLETLLGNIMGSTVPEGDAVAIPAPPPRPEPATEPAAATVVDQPAQELTQSFSNDSFPIDLDEPEPEPELESDDNEEPEEGKFDAQSLLDNTLKKSSKKESMKDLRKLAQTHKEEKDALQQEYQTAQEELDKYRKGEVLPDTIKQRMDELESKVNVFDFKNSPEYRRKIIEPIEGLKTRARALAAEYEIDASVFDEAISIDNRKERNSFLQNHFDDLGALEAHEIINNLKDLDKKAIDAEKEPLAQLEAMRGELHREETLNQEDRIKSIITSAKPGWSAALSEVREKETYPELSLIANDEQHNQVVRQILEEARTEFTKTLQVMAASGVKELPAEVSKALAKRFVLSQASAVIAASRAQYFQKNQEMINNSKSMKKYNRPPVGSSTAGVKTVDQATKEPMTPNKAAAETLKNIGI